MIGTLVLTLAVTGATIDESKVVRENRVPSPATPDLGTAFRRAHRLVSEGHATRIKIGPGTYREAVLDLDWTIGKAADTLLVVEGVGEVRWTGTDPVPARDVRREGDLISFPWDKAWGNFAWSWGPKTLIGHRSEMVFVGDRPLRQRILERYEVTGVQQDPAVQNQVVHRYLETLDPAQTLQPGDFGVVERGEGRIYLKLPSDVRRPRIEVSTRKRLLDLVGKHNVVLRNLTFERCANDDREYGSLNPVLFGAHRDKPSRNILIDRCSFRWNSGTGLMVGGQDWTIRDSKFDYNGFAGLASTRTRNLLFQRNQTNFNVWRAWRGGEIGYFTGGFKLHEVEGHRIEGHTAIGNCTMGIWWDVHCHDLYAEDLILVDNTVNLQYELSSGPLVVRRMLSAGGRAEDGVVHLWGGTSEIHDSLLYQDYDANGRGLLYAFRIGERNDPHANQRPMVPGPQTLRDSLPVGGPRTAAFAMMDDVRRDPVASGGFVPYRGERNVFWHPGRSEFWNAWIADPARSGEEAKRAVKIPEWLSAHAREEQPRQADPMLRDPKNHDYRISPASSLHRERARWPQVALSAATRREMARFFEWSGFQPDRWGPLPPE